MSFTTKGPKPFVICCHMLSATRFELLQQLLRGEHAHTNEHHVLQRGCVVDVTTNEVHGNLSKGHDVLRTEKQARRLHTKRAEALGDYLHTHVS